MKGLAFLLMFAGVLSAVPQQEAVIVTYTEDTPDYILSEAKDAITATGGFITHEYMLIKGFAAKASKKALESVQAWGRNFNVIIEVDQMVVVPGGTSD